MANRVGKYKLSKKESALSLADGGTISGDVTITGDKITLSGLGSNLSMSLASNQLFLTGSAAFSGSHAGGLSPTAGNNDFNVVCITQ